MNTARVRPGLLFSLLASILAFQNSLALAVEPPRAISPGGKLTGVPNGVATFDAALYNTAILRIGFSDAKGRTVNANADSFIDITLIPAEGDVQGFRTEVSRNRFKQILRNLYEQLATQGLLSVNDPNSPSRQLDTILFQPVAEQLRRLRITTLLISVDSGLQAIPFAALHDGQMYFGDRFAFSLTPSIGLMKLALPQDRNKPRLFAAGASEFQGLNPLPLVPQELQRVSQMAGTVPFLNMTFTPKLLLDNATDPLLNRIHLATHAEFLPGGPDKARLYSGVGPMSLREFSKLRQRRGNAQLDLFTLSACRTALGDADSELGFAGLALQAVSRSAIGSLWYVDDVATSALFVQFYRYLDQGIPKAEALQLTRKAMATGRLKLVGDQVIGSDGDVLLSALTTAQQRRIASGLQHPYFWAGIELMGAPW